MERIGILRSVRLLLLCLFLTFPSLRFAADARAEEWANRLIPLPQTISFGETLSMSIDQMVIRPPVIQDVRIATALDLLRSFAQGTQGFEIALVLTSDMKRCPGELRKKLARVPNKDQAYAIQPIAKSGKISGLLLAANEPVGLLYAARTLQQLLLISKTGQQIKLPAVTILDWPDLEERGEWGWNLPHDCYSVADLKMNEIEIHSTLGFKADGSPSATLDKKLLNEWQRIGIKVVPIIRHLEQLAATGLFKYHPEVAAVREPGKELPSDYQPGVCFSNPKSIELVAGWMKGLLSYEGVNDINAWLAESPMPCFCDRCRGRNTYELQTSSLIRAFAMAGKGHPKSHLRILLSQASYKDNDKVLAALSPDTRVTYYSGQTTYDSSHEPMIYPLLESFVRSGHWLGVYPQLTNSWRTVFPFTGAHFIKARMTEFIDKGLHSFSGYATPANCYYDFNIAASAEWSWNSRGRTVRQFAEAYATRIGLKQPKLFSEWADLIGQVGWNLAGSRVVESLIFAGGGQIFVDGFIRDGVLFSKDKPLEFGKGMLKEYADQQKLDSDIAAGEQALQLAVRADEPLMLLESSCVVNTLLFVKHLKSFIDEFRRPYSENQAKLLQHELNQLDDAARKLTVAMTRWGSLVNPAEQEALHYRFRDSVDFATTMAGQLRKWVNEKEVADPCSSYRYQPVAQWQTADFDSTTNITLWADVTDQINTAGEYDVCLFFREGAAGVEVKSVTLMAGPGKEAGQTLFSDRWDGRLSQYGRYVEYWIRVPEKPRNLANALDRYFIKVEIYGPSLDLPRDRRTTSGEVLLRKSWRDADMTLN